MLTFGAPKTPKREPHVVYATVRDGDDAWHIECRFDDGQKFAAIEVDLEHEQLADRVAEALSSPVTQAASTDEQHARKIKDIAKLLNRAIDDATSAGLTVTAECIEFREQQRSRLVEMPAIEIKTYRELADS